VEGPRGKTVGRRKPWAGSVFSREWEGFLKGLSALRRDDTFVPRGVWRFRTWEEFAEWSVRMRAGAVPSAGPRNSAT